MSPEEDQHVKIKAVRKMVILQIRLHNPQALMECVELEVTFKDSPGQSPCHGQGHIPLDRVVQTFTNVQTWERRFFGALAHTLAPPK